MRSLWNGSLAIGKVTIPVSLHKSAEHVDDVSLKTLHAVCGTPLKHERNCPTCNVTVAASDEDGGEKPAKGETVRAYEFAPGQFVIVESEDIEKAIGGKQVQIDRTIPAALLTAPLLDNTYWIAPSADPHATHAYEALLRALDKTKRVGLGRLAFYSRERVAAIWPVEAEGVRILGLTTLFPVAGIRTADATDIRDRAAAPTVTAAEVKLFGEVLDQLAVPASFHWRAVKRYYPSRLQPMLEAKQKGGKVVVAPRQADSVAPQDLNAALKATVRALGPKGRGRSPARA